jgi:hypothetical protein
MGGCLLVRRNRHRRRKQVDQRLLPAAGVCVYLSVDPAPPEKAIDSCVVICVFFGCVVGIEM